MFWKVARIISIILAVACFILLAGMIGHADYCHEADIENELQAEDYIRGLAIFMMCIASVCLTSYKAFKY